MDRYQGKRRVSSLSYTGSKNLPYDDMEQWEKRLDKSKTYVLYCERGSLSMMAAKQLLKDGYSVCTLIGGIRAVQERNLD